MPPHDARVQFFKFAVIGGGGFVWDTLIVTALAPRLGVYAAGLVSYALVATLNWWLNRRWTYGHLSHGRRAPQWGRFMAANLVGLVLNRGSYATLLALWAPAHQHLVLPVALGGVAGMFANFFLSRGWVYKTGTAAG